MTDKKEFDMSKIPAEVKFADGRVIKMPREADDLPKLPPRAVRKVLNWYKDNEMDPEAGIDMDETEGVVNLVDLAVLGVALTLKRMDRSITHADVDEDMALDDVFAIFGLVVHRNETIFGGKKDKPDPKDAAADESEDPN